MPDINPTVPAAIITGSTALLAAGVTAWRKSGGGGPTMTATTYGDNSPINQQLLQRTVHVEVKGRSGEQPRPLPAAWPGFSRSHRAASSASP